AFYVTPAMMSILGATHEDMELILKGLGYKSEAKPEAEIKPAPEAETATEAKPAEATADADKAEAAEGEENSEEEKTILVWRVARAERPAGNNKFKNNKSKKNANKAKGKDGDAKKPFSKRAPKPEKKMDPDSPFAKLAALKQNMGN
ncbi:MAG: helicase, partial [Nitratireductor sp.]